MAMEGWNWIHGSPKWHYFLEDGRAICRKWMTFGDNSDAQQGNDTSPDNCKACRKALEKRAAKAAK